MVFVSFYIDLKASESHFDCKFTWYSHNINPSWKSKTDVSRESGAFGDLAAPMLRGRNAVKVVLSQ